MIADHPSAAHKALEIVTGERLTCEQVDRFLIEVLILDGSPEALREFSHISDIAVALIFQRAGVRA